MEFDPLFRPFDPAYLALTGAIEGISRFQRQFFPPQISTLRQGLVPLRELLEQTGKDFQTIAVPTALSQPKTLIKDSLSLAFDALDTILNASTTDFQQTITQVMRAFRKICRAQEKLYTLCLTSAHLNRFFLEPGCADCLEHFAPPQQRKSLVGLHHFGVDDDYYARGALSLYVPEFYDDSKKRPLVLALHGGAGHGRDFIWSWLREARSRGFILACPTSRDTTWSILTPGIDAQVLMKMIDFLVKHHQVDLDRVLLTGMSDGGTFALMCSLLQDTPFTAFAPVAGVLPATEVSSAQGKRIYWTHGALDWVFPVHRAGEGCAALKRVGADVTLRVIDDLSHTYPRDQNKHILNWFDPSLS